MSQVRKKKKGEARIRFTPLSLVPERLRPCWPLPLRWRSFDRALQSAAQNDVWVLRSFCLSDSGWVTPSAACGACALPQRERALYRRSAGPASLEPAASVAELYVEAHRRDLAHGERQAERLFAARRDAFGDAAGVLEVLAGGEAAPGQRAVALVGQRQHQHRPGLDMVGTVAERERELEAAAAFGLQVGADDLQLRQLLRQRERAAEHRAGLGQRGTALRKAAGERVAQEIGGLGQQQRQQQDAGDGPRPGPALPRRGRDTRRAGLRWNVGGALDGRFRPEGVGRRGARRSWLGRR